MVHQNHEDEKNSSEFFEPSRIDGLKIPSNPSFLSIIIRDRKVMDTKFRAQRHPSKQYPDKILDERRSTED
jgi:hypothetical protein